MTAALEGVRVLDASVGLVGPVAAMLMADFGADVVKVPVGRAPDDDDPGSVVWRRNKRILPEADPAVIDRLLRACDVCITSAPVADLSATGLAPRQIRASASRVVHLHCPPSSAGAPWAGGSESNGLLAAWMGVGWRQLSSAAVPVETILSNVLYMQAVWGAAAALAALVERERSGLGQTVTVDGIHAVLVAAVSALVIDPTAEPDSADVGPAGKNPWYARYQCADGEWLFLGSLLEKFQRAALGVLRLERLALDPRIGAWSDFLNDENRPWLQAHLSDAFLARPRDEWLQRLEAADCPSGPLLRREEWLDHPQVRALGLAVELDDPEVGQVVMPGVPLQASRTPGAVRSPGRPVRGGEIDWPPRADTASPTSPDDPLPAGPLAGVRIADLGSILAGPFTGSLLADLGADVIKVEPIEGESFRVPGQQYNRGMRSLALDLKSEQGYGLFISLVKSLDVVVDNYRPGVAERLGVDYATLSLVNPEIVTLSISGFGDYGPLQHLPGFDPILQAMSGMMHAQGGPSAPSPLSFAINDVAAATMSVFGVCVALFHRAKTGEGQRIVNTLAGMATFIQSSELVRFPGRPPAPVGGPDHPGPGALDRYYPAADGWIRIQAEPTDLEALRDGGWLSAGAWGLDADALVEELTSTFGKVPAHEIADRLRAQSIPAVVVRRFEELPSDPDLVASGALIEDRLGDGTPVYLPGRFARFSRTERSDVVRPPGLGEHSRDVLSEAGIGVAAIEAAISEGHVRPGGPMDLEIFPLFR